MGYLTYTALRDLETTGYLKTGSDISAAIADDSFNASVISLSGLLADQWAKVAGFVNAANNGFFQAKSNSTSGKIIQTTPPITHLRLPASARISIAQGATMRGGFWRFLGIGGGHTPEEGQAAWS